MSTASKFLSSVRQTLDAKEINYELVEGKDMLKIRGLPLTCKLKEFNCLIGTTDYYCTINAYVSLSADEDSRAPVAEYITRANYGLRAGKFEMDFDDGEILFSLSIDCEDRSSLSEDMVMSTLLGTPYRMLNKYGDGLVAVMYGFKTPADAIEEAEA
jgi:hypothetical protein